MRWWRRRCWGGQALGNRHWAGVKAEGNEGWTVKIGSRQIGAGQPVYIIAELGVNHDGSAARAMELVEMARGAGADAVKLQYFETDRLMSRSAKLAAYQKAAGETDPVAMLRRLELRIEDMGPIVERAHGLGMHAIVTVFSTELVESAERLEWDAYKTASPDIVHRPLLERLCATERPLIVSTGASTMEEVERAVGWIGACGARERTGVLQCVSSYPTSLEQAALGGIEAIRGAVGGVVGYSDHTADVRTGAWSVAWGAEVLEKHLTYDRGAAGPDHAASLDPAMFKDYCRAVRDAFVVMNPGSGAAQTEGGRRVVDANARLRAELEPIADAIMWSQRMWARLLGRSEPGYERRMREAMARAEEAKRKDVLAIEEDVRRVSRQSVVALRGLTAGEVIGAGDVTIKRPGTGFLPFEMGSVVGKRVVRAVEADTVIGREDVA